jgi:transcriptional regulator with XRE-family HTH domain
MRREQKGMGKRIREQRTLRSYNLSQFAEMFGISESYVGLLERGDRSPSLSLLRKISVRLGVSIDYLMFGEQAESKGDVSQIFADENSVRSFNAGSDWRDTDKESVFGLSLGKALKPYGLNDDELSYIYSAVFYIAWNLQKRKQG